MENKRQGEPAGEGMINYYIDAENFESRVATLDNLHEIKEAVWIDLFCPIREEEKQVEQLLGFEIPSREEMREIEFSSRLYKENNNLFMTAMMIADSESETPSYDAVTFILTSRQLITLRYIEPKAIRYFAQRLKKIDYEHRQPTDLLIDLLDASIDRLADTLELVGRRLEEFSMKVLLKPSDELAKHGIHVKIDYQSFLRQIGMNGDLNTKVRESLVTFNRLMIFFGQTANARINNEIQSKMGTLSEDIRSLSDYVNFLSNKVNFLLDATLGLVTIEQNNIIKIFSIAAVIFLPPTLIASIYGMNFHIMPELSWRWGYPLALCLLLISAWLPYKFFKLKKWL